MKQWMALIIIVLCFWGAFAASHYWLVHHPDHPDQRTLKVIS